MCWQGNGEVCTPVWILCLSFVVYEMGNLHSIHLGFCDTLPLSTCTDVESNVWTMSLGNVLCCFIAQSGSEGFLVTTIQVDWQDIQSKRIFPTYKLNLLALPRICWLADLGQLLFWRSSDNMGAGKGWCEVPNLGKVKVIVNNSEIKINNILILEPTSRRYQNFNWVRSGGVNSQLLGRLKEEDHKYKVSLGYRGNSRVACAIRKQKMELNIHTSMYLTSESPNWVEFSFIGPAPHIK